ncbi:MAG: hypothetical protein JKY15_01955 [Deltaproteobacteria bacterium]|nr:hypothetical protein [Deltaproteobacteria bacterium]
MNGDFDISDDCKVVEINDTSPIAIKIILNAPRGKYITKHAKIKKWDRIYIETTSKSGRQFKTVVHVRIKKKDRKNGLQLTLWCPHQTSNRLKAIVSISTPNRRISGEEAAINAVNQINSPENKGTKDPEIVFPATFNKLKKHGSRLNDRLSNNYIAEAIPFEDFMDSIVDIEGNVPELGGSREFHYWRFQSLYNHATGLDLDNCVIQIAEQGFQDNLHTSRAISKVSSGALASIKVVNGGEGYSSAPAVTILGRGTGAAATAVLTGGKVTSITVDTPGTGYTTPPEITLTASPTEAFTSTPNVTLKKSALNDYTSNTLELDSNEEPEEATNIIVICDKNSGDFLGNAYAKFQGAKDAFRLTKLWEQDKSYLKGILLKHNNLTYEAKSDHSSTAGQNPSVATTLWIQRFFTKAVDWVTATSYTIYDIIKVGDIAYEALQSHTSSSGNKPANDSFWVRINFVPTTDYSPQTKGNAQYWINALGGYVDANTNNGKTAYIDHNSIIKDKNHPRTDVDGVYLDSASIPVHLKKLIGGTRYPIDGLRILVNGVGLNDFAAIDDNGLIFDNTIAVFRDPQGLGTTGVWFVLEHWGAATNDDEVYDYEKGDSWTYNHCLTGLNLDGTCTGARSGVWSLGAYTIIGAAAVFQANGQFDCVHPVKFDVGAGRVAVGNSKISEDDVDSNSAVFIQFEPDTADSKKIAGLNWTAMMPRNENFIPYNTVTIGEKISLSVIDFLNKHKTHLGKKEWFGPGVEDYMDIQGFAFFQKIDEVFLGLLPRPTGNYKMLIWLVDENDNKITIDYLQKKRGSATPLTASLGKRKIQHSVPGISTFIRANEPEVLEIFDFEKVRRGGIETAESFDQDDRFRTFLTDPNPLNLSRFTGSSELTLSIDGFRLTKPLVVTNVDDENNKPDRNIPSELISAPDVVSYSQAKNLVRNLVPILNHEKDEFPIVKKFSNDVGWGDSVYYEDSEAVDDTTDGKANTIKMVVDNNFISISKGGDGAPGGFRQTEHLINRVWSS